MLATKMWAAARVTLVAAAVALAPAGTTRDTAVSAAAMITNRRRAPLMDGLDGAGAADQVYVAGCPGAQLLDQPSQAAGGNDDACGCLRW
jgi:hypothetical protein